MVVAGACSYEKIVMVKNDQTGRAFRRVNETFRVVRYHRCLAMADPYTVHTLSIHIEWSWTTGSRDAHCASGLILFHVQWPQAMRTVWRVLHNAGHPLVTSGSMSLTNTKYTKVHE